MSPLVQLALALAGKRANPVEALRAADTLTPGQFCVDTRFTAGTFATAASDLTDTTTSEVTTLGQFSFEAQLADLKHDYSAQEDHDDLSDTSSSQDSEEDEPDEPVSQKVSPGFQSAEGFGTRKGRYAFADKYRKNNGPARGGTVDCPLYSYEIDAVLQMAPDLNALPAEFMPILRSDPSKAKDMFLAMSYPILLPVHCEFHWTAVRIDKGHVYSADSDPHPSHTTHVELLVRALSLWTHSVFTYSLIPVPSQPPGSAECGVHTTINCLAMGWSVLKGSAGYSDYALLRPLMKRVEQGTLRPSGLLMAARALCAKCYLSPFKPVTKTNAKSVLRSFTNGESVQVLFREQHTREVLRLEFSAGDDCSLPDGDILSVISTNFFGKLPTPCGSP